MLAPWPLPQISTKIDAMTSTRTPTWLILRPSTWRQMGRDLAYLLPGFAVGLLALIVVISLVMTGATTLILGIGLPILVLALAVARWFADVNLALLRRWAGQVPPTLYELADYRSISGMVDVLRDEQRWRNVLHALVPGFIYRTFAFCVTIVWLATTAAGLTAWFWGGRVVTGSRLAATTGLDSLADSPATQSLLEFALGLLFLLTLPVVLHGLAAADAAIARGLLTNENAVLRARGDRLSAQRAQVVAEEASTLRKVERDLHDGPQQRLIRLQMDMQAAQRKLDDDPAAARALMDQALEQSSQALAELRSLSRGIAPPILADRGLAAAVESLAARATVPVRVDCDLPARLPESAENAAYFVVAESLANIAKHSGATAATVSASASPDALVVRIEDDGVGGAHLGKGHGLAGLADRLAGVDGELEVDSPAGGPTRIEATIPLG